MAPASTWLTLLLIGRLLTWLGQTSGPTRRLWRLHPLLAELGQCDLCLGTWVCALLAWLLGCNIIWPAYVPVVSEFVTGAAASFGLHLARAGWQVEYGVTEIRVDETSSGGAGNGGGGQV